MELQKQKIGAFDADKFRKAWARDSLRPSVARRRLPGSLTVIVAAQRKKIYTESRSKCIAKSTDKHIVEHALRRN